MASVNLHDYEEIPRISLLASKWIVDAWERLGKPQSPLSNAGGKIVAVVLATWEELYPQEAKEWYEGRKEYQNAEMSLTEQVHRRTGRSLATYPFQVYQMLKRIFPDFKFSERNNCIKLVKKFPVFRMANRV